MTGQTCSHVALRKPSKQCSCRCLLLSHGRAAQVKSITAEYGKLPQAVIITLILQWGGAGKGGGVVCHGGLLADLPLVQGKPGIAALKVSKGLRLCCAQPAYFGAGPCFLLLWFPAVVCVCSITRNQHKSYHILVYLSCDELCLIKHKCGLTVVSQVHICGGHAVRLSRSYVIASETRTYGRTCNCHC